MAICAGCSKDFTPKQRFCCSACRLRAHRNASVSQGAKTPKRNAIVSKDPFEMKDGIKVYEQPAPGRHYSVQAGGYI